MMYIVNFEIPAFLLSLLCFVYSLAAKRRQYIPPKTLKNKLMSQHFVFLLMLMTNMLSSISSVVGVYLTNATIPNVGFWQYLFHAFYFIFHSTLSVVFTLYIINVTGTSLNWKAPGYVLFALPYGVSELLILTNSLTNWAFYMDAERIYHRGSLMLLLYGIGAFYVVMGFVFFLKNMKAVSKVDRILQLDKFANVLKKLVGILVIQLSRNRHILKRHVLKPRRVLLLLHHALQPLVRNLLADTVLIVRDENELALSAVLRV